MISTSSAKTTTTTMNQHQNSTDASNQNSSHSKPSTTKPKSPPSSKPNMESFLRSIQVIEARNAGSYAANNNTNSGSADCTAAFHSIGTKSNGGMVDLSSSKRASSTSDSPSHVGGSVFKFEGDDANNYNGSKSRAGSLLKQQQQHHAKVKNARNIKKTGRRRITICGGDFKIRRRSSASTVASGAGCGYGRKGSCNEGKRHSSDGKDDDNMMKQGNDSSSSIKPQLDLGAYQSFLDPNFNYFNFDLRREKGLSLNKGGSESSSDNKSSVKNTERIVETNDEDDAEEETKADCGCDKSPEGTKEEVADDKSVEMNAISKQPRRSSVTFCSVMVSTYYQDGTIIPNEVADLRWGLKKSASDTDFKNNGNRDDLVGDEEEALVQKQEKVLVSDDNYGGGGGGDDDDDERVDLKIVCSALLGVGIDTDADGINIDRVEAEEVAKEEASTMSVNERFKTVKLETLGEVKVQEKSIKSSSAHAPKKMIKEATKTAANGIKAKSDKPKAPSRRPRKRHTICEMTTPIMKFPPPPPPRPVRSTNKNDIKPVSSPKPSETATPVLFPPRPPPPPANKINRSNRQDLRSAFQNRHKRSSDGWSKELSNQHLVCNSNDSVYKASYQHRRDYDLGDTCVSDDHMMDFHLSNRTNEHNALEDISRLKIHDFAFVKRSNGEYTYCVLADRCFIKTSPPPPPSRCHRNSLPGSNDNTHGSKSRNHKRATSKPRPIKAKPDPKEKEDNSIVGMEIQQGEEFMRFVTSMEGHTKLIKKRHWVEMIRLVNMHDDAGMNLPSMDYDESDKDDDCYGYKYNSDCSDDWPDSIGKVGMSGKVSANMVPLPTLPTRKTHKGRAA